MTGERAREDQAREDQAREDRAREDRAREDRARLPYHYLLTLGRRLDATPLGPPLLGARELLVASARAWRRSWATLPGRFLHALLALALAGLIVVPALPTEYSHAWFGKERVDELSNKMRAVSLSQRWIMYSPDPSRWITLLALTEYRKDGTRVRLEEHAKAEDGWGTHWWWTKSRKDIWQYYAAIRRKRPNPNRTWFLKGVCVRETRDHPDDPPVRILAESVRRRINPPDKVRAGAPDIGPEQRETIQLLDCRIMPVQNMLKDDPARDAAE